MFLRRIEYKHPRSKSKKKSGKRNTSLCDCCTEPMRNIIVQLAGQTIAVRTFGSSFMDTVPPQPIVNKYLARLQNGQVIAICHILYLTIDAALVNGLDLETIRREEGECSCCEDSMTELLNQNIGNIFVFTLINGESSIAQILRVGEGIVLLINEEGATLVTSTCMVDNIRPI